MIERLCGDGDDCLLLFARAPLIGRVKSRLRPPLTAEQACALHLATLRDTAEMMERSQPNLSKWIFWSEAPLREVIIDLPPSLRSTTQCEGDLGRRMQDAFQRAFDSGARRTVIIGSDSPHLPAERLSQAFAALEASELVLGPAEDGGFYLIGSRRLEARVFDGVEWGGADVLRRTSVNAARCGYSVSLLEPCYDLDRWEDVERLRDSGAAVPRHLQMFLQEFSAAKEQ
jgi:uncharacterized protein